MAIECKKTTAVFDGDCMVEDAEQLLGWLLTKKQPKVNLKSVGHIHSAVLQVLMACKPEVTIEPQDKQLASWLMPAIQQDVSNEQTIHSGGSEP